MCANDDSEALSTKAYDILQDIIILLVERSWYTIELEDGPSFLYNVIHNGISLDTNWQKPSYSGNDLLKVSRIINEALYSVCPAQPISQKTIQILKQLQTRLMSVPTSIHQESIVPIGCPAINNDILSKFFLIFTNNHAIQFIQSNNDTHDKEASFLKKIFEMSAMEYSNLKSYREHWEQAWELVSKVINVTRERCNGLCNNLSDYNNYYSVTGDTVEVVEKECTELYPFFFLHKLDQYLESLESKDCWLIQDKLFNYFENMPPECFSSFCKIKSSVLSTLMAGATVNNLILDSILKWYNDLSRFSLRRCIMLCTVFIEDLSPLGIQLNERDTQIEKMYSKCFVNDWNANHSNFTIMSMCESLNEILEKHSA